jgi:hypothetical protein
VLDATPFLNDHPGGAKVRDLAIGSNLALNTNLSSLLSLVNWRLFDLVGQRRSCCTPAKVERWVFFHSDFYARFLIFVVVVCLFVSTPFRCQRRIQHASQTGKS